MCQFGISLELKLFEEMMKELWPCFKSSSECGRGHPESTMFNFHSTSALYLLLQTDVCRRGALIADKSLLSLLSEVGISVLSIWTVILQKSFVTGAEWKTWSVQEIKDTRKRIQICRAILLVDSLRQMVPNPDFPYSSVRTELPHCKHR